VQRRLRLLIACPTAAINWSLKYFLYEDLQKSTLNLLWAGKYMHTFTVPCKSVCWLFLNNKRLFLIGKLQWLAQVVDLNSVSLFIVRLFRLAQVVGVRVKKSLTLSI
jgi:hypothetical protein